MRSCRKCGHSASYLETQKEWVCSNCYRKGRDFQVSVEEKPCTKCLVVKPSFEFHLDKRNKTGLQGRCKECYEQWYQSNKVAVGKRGSEWKRVNSDKHCASQAKRRSKKLEATPQWLSQEQLEEIDYLYWLAKDLKAITGEEYHVDHVVPLQGVEARGLHVPWNLQVLPYDLNIKKGNKL